MASAAVEVVATMRIRQRGRRPRAKDQSPTAEPSMAAAGGVALDKMAASAQVTKALLEDFLRLTCGFSGFDFGGYLWVIGLGVWR